EALTSTKQSTMARISPTASTTMSVPFLSAAARAALDARRRVTGSGLVKGRSRPSTSAGGTPGASRGSVEAPGPDLPYHRRWHEPVDRSAGGQTGPHVARRHVEAGNGEPLEAPAATGRLGVGVAGALDD